LPGIDPWAVFPAGRPATAKARAFVSFVHEVLHRPDGANSPGWFAPLVRGASNNRSIQTLGAERLRYIDPP
jgi:hypothetical protein